MHDPRYPIGRFELGAVFAASVEQAVRDIATLPEELEQVVADRSEADLDVPYRDGGWTVRQVVHHLADSHANAAIRTRLALTEVHPTIRPYDEGAWANLVDARTAPIASSLVMVRALHERWSLLLASLDPSAFGRTLHHPERGDLTLGQLIALYGWHGRHHVAHIHHAPRA
jgi:hypothetical protein